MKKYSPLIYSILIIFAMLLPCGIVSAQVETGNKAPGFKAIDDTGQTWKLSDHIGKKIIVLYFYPAAMTGGCTKQACGYRDNKNMLSALNTIVVGVSGDEVQNLKWFKEAENLNFPLLSDADGKIAKKYGVPVRDGGAIVRNINGTDQNLTREITTARWTFIIDMDGKIAYKNSEVKAAEDSRQVIEIIKSL
jgi:peroxiredoxin Q/BCP